MAVQDIERLRNRLQATNPPATEKGTRTNLAPVGNPASLDPTKMFQGGGQMPRGLDPKQAGTEDARKLATTEGASMAAPRAGRHFEDPARVAGPNDLRQQPGTVRAGQSTPTTDVTEIATEMMGDDSRLMRAAATKGRQFGNARGLMNSSISAGAAMDSALKYVEPFATQEATQRHDAAMKDKDFGYDLALQDDTQAHDVARADQDFGHDMALQDDDQKFQTAMEKLGFKHDSKLSDQEFEQAMALSDQEFKEATGLTKQQFEYDWNLAKQKQEADAALAQLDADTRTQLMTMEQGMRTQLAQMEIDAAQKEKIGDMITVVSDNYQKNLNSILANPNLSAEARNDLLKSAGTLMQNGFDMISSTFDFQIDWMGGNFNASNPKNPTGTKKDDDKKGGKKNGKKGGGKKGGGKKNQSNTNPGSAGDSPGGH